jgi:hypothetical protein
MFTDRSTAKIDEYTRITVVFGNLNRYEVDDTAHAPFDHASVDGSPFAFRYLQNNTSTLPNADASACQLLSSGFAGGLCCYLIYGPGYEYRSASIIGFSLNMAGKTSFPLPPSITHTLAVGFSRQLLTMVRIANQIEGKHNHYFPYPRHLRTCCRSGRFV